MVNMTLTTPAPFAVYVHWPFCLSKCPYCDFNSHVRHGGVDEARFVRAFAAEIAATAARVPGRTVSTDLLRRRHAVADAAGDGAGASSTRSPSTGPSRPTSRSRSKPIRPASRRRAFAAIAPPASTASRSACRRSTMRALKELGRLHTAQEALDAVAVARAIFERYSFDLIYARPRPDAGGLGAPSSSARIARSGRASLALSAHHRAGHAVLRRCTRPASSSCPTTTLGARSLRH